MFHTTLGTLHLGDCLNVLANVPSNSIDLVATDPPYQVGYKTGHRQHKQHEFCVPIMNDDNPALIQEYFRECYRVMRDNTALYTFCSWPRADFFKQELERHFTIRNMLIWVKNNWTAGDLKAAFGRQYEIVFVAHKGRALLRGKRFSDVWQFDRIVGNAQWHQNQKPLPLMRRMILAHSDENDLVFDGFMGSGTTAIACEQLHRRWLGSEIDKLKYNKAVERIQGELRQISLF